MDNVFLIAPQTATLTYLDTLSGIFLIFYSFFLSPAPLALKNYLLLKIDFFFSFLIILKLLNLICSVRFPFHRCFLTCRLLPPFSIFILICFEDFLCPISAKKWGRWKICFNVIHRSIRISQQLMVNVQSKDKLFIQQRAQVMVFKSLNLETKK